MGQMEGVLREGEKITAGWWGLIGNTLGRVSVGVVGWLEVEDRGKRNGVAPDSSGRGGGGGGDRGEGGTAGKRYRMRQNYVYILYSSDRVCTGGWGL